MPALPLGLLLDLLGHLGKLLLLRQESWFWGFWRLNERWKGGLELLLCRLREAREDLLENFLELRGTTVVVPPCCSLGGYALPHSAQFVPPLHKLPIEDAFGQAATAVRTGLLDVRHIFRSCPQPVYRGKRSQTNHD